MCACVYVCVYVSVCVCGARLGLHTSVYHWGEKYYLPKFCSRRTILGSCMCFFVYEREALGELVLNILQSPFPIPLRIH